MNSRVSQPERQSYAKPTPPPPSFDLNNIKSTYYHSKYLAKTDKSYIESGEKSYSRADGQPREPQKFSHREQIQERSRLVKRQSFLKKQGSYNDSQNYYPEAKFYQSKRQKQQTHFRRDHKRDGLIAKQKDSPFENKQNYLYKTKAVSPLRNTTQFFRKTDSSRYSEYPVNSSLKVSPLRERGSRQQNCVPKEFPSEHQFQFKKPRQSEYNYEQAKNRQKQRGKQSTQGRLQTRQKLQSINKLNAQINQRIRSILDNFNDIK